MCIITGLKLDVKTVLILDHIRNKSGKDVDFNWTETGLSLLQLEPGLTRVDAVNAISIQRIR